MNPLDRLQFQSLPSPFPQAGRLGALLGVAGLCGSALLWLFATWFASRWPDARADFFKAWLFAWLLCLGMSLGAMIAVMIHHLTGGEWGYFVRRPGEAAANVLPLLFLLFLPLFAGLKWIYPWAAATDHSAVLVHNRAYLNPVAFAVRFVLYFTVWVAVAWSLRMLSRRHDRTVDSKSEHQMRVISAAGLVAYFITMSLAAIDWIMSMEPQWYSSVFGFIVCLGQAISGVSVLIIVLTLLSDVSPISERLRPKHFNDLATLLVTAVILWAYNALSQLLIIWMGNIQREIPWYVKRSHGSWRVMGELLIFVGFFAPFILLLQRSVKKRGPALVWVCGGLLIMRAVDVYWMIAPAGPELYPGFHSFNLLASLVALIGIAGAWLACFVWLLDGQALMPAGEQVPIDLVSGHEITVDSKAKNHGEAINS